MKRVIIFGLVLSFLLLSLLLITSCVTVPDSGEQKSPPASPSESLVSPESESAPSPAPSLEVKPEEVSPESTEATSYEEMTASVSTASISYDPEIERLLNKAKPVENYQYYLTSRVRNKYETYDHVNYYAYIMPSKVKKVYPLPVKLSEEIYYNEVYLDLAAKKATLICTDKTFNACRKMEKEAYTAGYEEMKLSLTPKETIGEIPVGAVIKGEEVFNNRKALVITFNNMEGNEVRISLDQFSGLPIKRIVYASSEGDNLLTLEEYRFDKLGVRNVGESEVTLPTDYTLIK